MLTPAEIRETLRKQALEVEFVKKNGELRQIWCTTHMPTIRQIDPNAVPSKTMDDPATYFRVFDLEKSAWRSFHYDQIETAHPAYLPDLIG